MKKRILSMILAAIMLMSVLTACGTYGDTTTGGQQTSTRPNTKEGYGSVSFCYQEPNTLNLLTSQSNLDADAFYLLSVMLYRPYDDYVIPEMTTGYTVSEDGLTYTYPLKEAYYTDGTKITASDFVYYILNAVSVQAEFLPYVKNGQKYMNGECEPSEVGVYAKDEMTLVVELEQKTAAFVPELEVYPLNQEFAESKGDALGGTPDAFKYSGPYILTEWVYGSSMTYKKNPDYIDAENSFQIAELKMVNTVDANTQYNMFTTGEVDILCSTSEEVTSRLSQQPGSYMSGSLHMLEFNTTGFYFNGETFAPRDAAATALLANQNFRLALCYALNREAIVGLVDAKSQATNRYFATVFGTEAGKTFAEQNPIDVPPVNGDEAKAREYLQKAMEELGYTDVSQLPTIKYLTFENGTFRTTAETIQSEWKRVLGIENIEIDLKPIQDAIMSMVFMNYDIYYQPGGVNVRNAWQNMDYWKTGGGLSDAMQAGAPISSIFSNAEFDAKVAAAALEMDETVRNKLLAEAEEMLIQSCIIIPIMDQGGMYLVNDRVQGYVAATSGISGLMFNYAYVVE